MRISAAAIALLFLGCSVSYRPTPVHPSLSAAPEVRVAALLSDGRLIEFVAPSRQIEKQLQLGPAVAEPRPLRGLVRDVRKSLVYALDPATQATVHVIGSRSWTQTSTVTLGVEGDRYFDLEIGAQSGRLFAVGMSAHGDAVLAIAPPGATAAMRTVLRPSPGGDRWLPLAAALAPDEKELLLAFTGHPAIYDRISLQSDPVSLCPAPGGCGAADGGVAAGGTVSALAIGTQLILSQSGSSRSVANGFTGDVAPLALAVPPHADRIYVLARCGDGGLSSVDVRTGQATTLEHPGANAPCGAVLRAASDETLVASAPGIWTIGVRDRAAEEAPDLGTLVLDALPI